MVYINKKVKKTGLCLTVLICLSVGGARAQGIDQLIQQLVLDIQKLSQLKTILNDMKDGYQVLEQGYSQIRDIAIGNFDLHKTFLDRLLAVSPNVRGYYKVPAILDKQQSILAETSDKRWIAANVFTTAELDYIRRAYSALKARARDCMDRLTMVTTAGELRMSDADRLEAIDRIHADIAQQLEGLRGFNDALTIQALQRAREYNNIQTLKRLYGNHP